MTFRAKHRDANERAIVDALRAVGASVQHLGEKGVPDLLVGFQGTTFLLEVKNPKSSGGADMGGKRTKGRGKLQPTQLAWFESWKGSPVVEVISAHEALAAIGVCVAHRRPVPCAGCAREVVEALHPGGMKL